MAKKNLRSSQVISTFGIGQIVNFPGDVSVIIAGLNEWEEVLENNKRLYGQGSIDLSKLIINEPRLQELLGVDYFMKPFPFKTTGTSNKSLELPCFRFPSWHYCTNVKCGAMKQIPLNLQDDKIECYENGCKSKMIPIRFVAVCSNGHLQDVPFQEWVHNGNQFDSTHKLTYISTGGSGDLGSIVLKCSCGARKSLAGLMNVQKENGIVYNSPLASLGNQNSIEFSLENPNNSNPSGCYCKGHKPWLGTEGTNSNNYCGNHLEVLIRGGSNIHYSTVTSTLFIPDFNENTNPIAATIINSIGLDTLFSYYEQDTNQVILKAVLSAQPQVLNRSISLETLLEEIDKLYKAKSTNQEEATQLTELELRKQEYQVLTKGHNAENGDLKAVIKNISNFIEADFLENYFSKIVAVEKLKETKVFTGFARINQANQVRRADLSLNNINWLPAIEVFGEGIFIEFNKDKIQEWTSQNSIFFNKLITNYEQSNSTRGPITKYSPISPEFILLHTFSHLLIKRLCFSSGYGSSSLRERIYFSNDESFKMYGILIYTSSGDAEGSLGGLVRQSGEKYLSKLIKEAIEEARWCSADPVCSVIGQKSGQGPDNVNGSACHNCCLLSETSCEVFNGLLDRASIIGTLENPSIGFFNS